MTDSDHLGVPRERTALAWSRTGLSFAVVGALLLRLLDEADAGAAPLWLAAAFVVLGAIAWAWSWRTPEVAPAIDTRLGRAVVTVLAGGLVAVAMIALAIQL